METYNRNTVCCAFIAKLSNQDQEYYIIDKQRTLIMDVKSDEPATKKAKLDGGGCGGGGAAAASATASSSTSVSTTRHHQSSLLQFFSSSGKKQKPTSTTITATTATTTTTTTTQIHLDEWDDSFDPIIPQTIPSPLGVSWQSLHNHHVLVRKPNLKGTIWRDSNGKPNDNRCLKVAAFDLDGTLVQWSSDAPGFWPSQLSHYELWNATVPTRLRQLYDDGYCVVVFTNQGGIQGAHNGKRATLVKTILDWLESLIQRPLCAIASTKSPKKSPQESFHKPSPHMWTKILCQKAVFGIDIDIGAGGGGADDDDDANQTRRSDWSSSSFFVGDSADEDDAQGGVDAKFAKAVGIPFFTPENYFGPSRQQERQRQQEIDLTAISDETPPHSLAVRNALLGRYYDNDDDGDSTPIMLILVGVQGSGKSTFCRLLVSGQDNNNDDDVIVNDNRKKIGTDNARQRRRWIWLSQDTINNGRPGRREQVEEEARIAIKQGHSVVIDRMHLDPLQRAYFFNIAEFCNVPAHIVVFNPPKAKIIERIKNRTNHPGNVQGQNGVNIALTSMAQLVMPTYEEDDFDLISCASTDYAATQLAHQYRATLIRRSDMPCATLATKIPVTTLSSSASSSLLIPTISLGTMGLGKRQCKETLAKMIAAGFSSIDTAPTYKNEDMVGEALQEVAEQGQNVFVIAKVPKRACNADEVRSELEKTLRNLQCNSVDLLLLHWPCDVILGSTLSQVWKCMEECLKEGKCKALGVCNFNLGALTTLLKTCTVPPVVNQVERHPLLAQSDLFDFCARNGILLQAHTPLGQGKKRLLANSVVKSIAQEASMTPAQVVLLWNLQQGVLVVPKCTQTTHANEILQLVSSSSPPKYLSPEQMQELDELDSGHRFVAPPFMYGKNVFCWGQRMPKPM
jgi:DNA 3'-phosphatase